MVRQFPDRFEVVALGAGCNAALLCEQIVEFSPRIVSVMDAQVVCRLENLLGGKSSCFPEILYGRTGTAGWPPSRKSDMLVSAMVGAAGLLPTLSAIEAGKNIALANKETLVCCGRDRDAGRTRQKRQNPPCGQRTQRHFSGPCRATDREALDRLLLTASGGPFFK